MNQLDEKEIRERLDRAVAPIDPIAPPLDSLRQRAVKLRRVRVSAGGGLLAAAAAAVTAAVIVAPAHGSSTLNAAAPSRASLTTFAAAQHGKHITGPIVDGSHYAGAFTTKKAIVVAEYRSAGWHTVRTFTSYGDGQYVLKLSDGGSVIPGHASFALRTVGGDVSYFGGVVYDANGSWRGAHFAKCAGHPNLGCAYAGGEQPYGHVVNGRFVAIYDNCTPNCAEGTDYRVTWRWDEPQHRFTVAKVTALR